MARGEKTLSTIFQIKTFTLISPLQQAFHFLGSRNQIVHFGYLALREYLPAVERRNPFAESVEELLDLIDSEARPLRHIDDRQVVQDTGFVPALPADALGIWEEANLLVVANCRSSQACSASDFANAHVRHIRMSLDLKRTLSCSVATDARKIKFGMEKGN